MIFDFRMSIFDLSQLLPRRSGFSRRYYNRSNCVRFLKQRAKSRCAQKFRSTNQFKPKSSFVCFLLHHTCFVDKVRSGFRSTKSAIVRPYRTSTSNNLIRDGVPAACPWKGVGQIENSHCKGFGSFFHFAFIHARL